MMNRKDTKILVESWTNFLLKETEEREVPPERKKVYLGNCRNSFNDDGDCIQQGVKYENVTAFAQGDERAIEISEQEFRDNVNIDEYTASIIDATPADQIFYLKDKVTDHYMIYDEYYDEHGDIHHIFG